MAQTKVKVRGGMYLMESPALEDVFTPEDLNSEQRMIGETARTYAEKVRGKLHDIAADKGGLSRPLLREAGELGLLSLEIPEEYGGMGLDKITSTLVTEEIGRAGSFGVTIGAHNGIGLYPILFFGTHEQKQKYLPKIATAEWISSYALTEPNSGSDALGAKSTARLSADGKYWILNGTKQWITNSGFADIFIVYAKVDGEKFSAFIVEKGFPGVSVGPEEKKMGLHASSTCSVILDDAQVPAENLLGEIGRGHVIALNTLNIGRFKLGAGVVGSTKHVLAVATQYAKTRKQFGKPLSEFRAIQQKLADMNIRTAVNEAMIYRSAGLLDANTEGLDHQSPDAGREAARRIEEYVVECSINKVFGSEVLDFVVDEAVQIHGGYGFMDEYEVSWAYRDSRINRIFEGTNEINRMLIPGMLLKRTMKGELPFMARMTGLQDELMNLEPFMESDEPLAQEEYMINRARIGFFLLAGLGAQKYQMALEHEQELLMGIADIAMEVYAMESAVLRAKKALLRGAPGLKADIARAYSQEAFERIGTIGRNMLPVLEEEGDVLRTQMSIWKRLMRYMPVNTVGIKRKIAERVIEKEGFVC